MTDDTTGTETAGEAWRHPKCSTCVEGWAPGNLQHHLIFAHHAQPSDVPYDGPLDQMHRDLHAAAIPEIEGQR